MKWTIILIIAAVVAILLLLKMTGRIPTKDARGYLHEGALVIDVRSPGEFNAVRLDPHEPQHAPGSDRPRLTRPDKESP